MKSMSENSPQLSREAVCRKEQKHKTDAKTFCLSSPFVLILNNKWLTAFFYFSSPVSPLTSMFLRLNRIIFIANHKKIYYPPMSPGSTSYVGFWISVSLSLAPSMTIFVSIIVSICRTHPRFDYHMNWSSVNANHH